MKRTHKDMLEKANYYQLNIDFCKNLYFQINTIDDIQNLLIFLKNEQKFNFILIAQFITSFFDLPYYKAAALYQEFNPRQSDTQRQFKEAVLAGEKIELLKIVSNNSDLINLFFAINNPIEKAKIFDYLGNEIKALDKKLKELVASGILTRTKKEKQNAYLYQLNPEKEIEIEKWVKTA